MITTLIIFLLLFLTLTSYYIFRNCFVRGEIFDITKKQLSSKSKLKKNLEKFKDNLLFIDSVESEWLYIKSYDGLRLAGRFFRNEKSNKIVILFHGYRSIAVNDFSIYFKWYYENGFNILLVDQRSHRK